MNTNDLRHNIFEYATKELSQDAFIAWLSSYAYEGSADKDYGLWSCAQCFLRSFVGKADDTTFTVTDIKMQHEKIDVYIEMEETKHPLKRYAVIVEDKVYSAHHDDQISRYVEKVQEKLDSPDRKIHVVYFKTGHIEDTEEIEIRRLTSKLKEKEVVLHKITLENIETLLKSKTSGSDTFNMYKTHIYHIKEKCDTLKERVTHDGFYSKDKDTNPLNAPYGQWCFLEKIFPERKMEDDDKMRESFNKWKETLSNYHGDQVPFAQDYMYSGSDKGDPWIQYCFWEAVHKRIESVDDNRPKHHSLFWRLEPDQISLRYYVNSGLKQPEKDEKLSYLWKLSEKSNSDFPVLPDKWKVFDKVRNNAKYEFVLLEYKFSPDEKIAILKEQIHAIHKYYTGKLPL